MHVLQAPNTEKCWSTKVNIRKNKVPTSQWYGHPRVLGRETDKSCRKLVPNWMNLRESGFLRVNMADEFLQKALQKARIFGDKIWSRVVSTEQKCTQVDMADAVLATALSGITFPLCLGILQTGLFRPLRITSNRRFIGSAFGTVSLLVSGSTASAVFLSSIVLFKEIKGSSLRILTEKLHSFMPNTTVDVEVCSRDIPLCGVASLVVYKIFGGRFRSVLPSSLIHPGAFAKRYIPAKGKRYASDGVKRKLALMDEFLIFQGFQENIK